VRKPDCGQGILRDTLARRLRALRPRPSRVLVVLDPGAAEVASPRIHRALADAGLEGTFLRAPRGEARKTLDEVGKLASRMVRAGADRRSFVLAVGGGVCSDMAGFAAASTLRGLRWGAVATTLLAMVDAAVGGKTAVNLPEGKNLFGAFHFPEFIVADTALLATLPAREWRAGRGELVKTAMLAGGVMWRGLAAAPKGSLGRRGKVLTGLARQAAIYKAGVVTRDPREGDERKLLNLGHTFGHALETAAGPRRLRHGEAVALGILCALRASAEHGMCAPDAEEEMRALYQRHDLPTAMPGPLPSAATLRRLMLRDKKADDGRLELVLPLAPGHAALVQGVDAAEAVAVIRHTLG
jgi:3-dehydroquinate synthase